MHQINSEQIPGLETLLRLPFYSEGPVIDSNGNIFCTTLTGNRVIKVNNTKRATVWGVAACPNGQVVLPNGDHLVCESKKACISRYDSEGHFIKNEISKNVDNTEVCVPNDLVVSEDGSIYFTDSIRKEGRVFFVSGKGQENMIASGLDYPNGVVLSRDEKQLFVSESYRNRILVIHLKSPGVAAGLPEVFSTLPSHPSGREVDNLPDGLAIDDNGCLWIAHYGMQALQVISPGGMLMHSFDTGMPLTSNIFIRDQQAIVTGGFCEPGPGALLRFHLFNVK